MKKSSVLLVALCAVQVATAVTISVDCPQVEAAKAVTVGGKASIACDAGKSVQLKATANAGWAFAGWYECYDAETGVFSNEVALDKSADWRSPSASYVAGEVDAKLYARFVQPADDQLEFDLQSVFDDLKEDVDGFDRPVLSLTNSVDVAVPFESASLPTVTVTGLPSGLKFDKSSLRLTGMPNGSGVYRVKVSAKNGSGFSYSQIFDVRVANVVSERVQGSDVEDYYVGTEINEDIDNIFVVDVADATVASLSITGQREAGLKIDYDSSEKKYYLRGTPTKAGDFLLSCSVKFSDGRTETANALITINELDPMDQNWDFDVYVSELSGYAVGDVLEDLYIGNYDPEMKVGITGVQSLPSGISVVKRADEYFGFEYYLNGRFTKPGEFTVKVAIAYEGEEGKINSMTLAKNVIVDDSPGVYLSVVQSAPEDDVGCKVKGSGVYAVGSEAKLAATASGAWVFAGWYDNVGELILGSTDYRNPSVSMAVDANSGGEYYATFIQKDEDWIEISMLSPEYSLDVNGEDVFLESFLVQSGSLPTLKFSNLPVGVTCRPSSEMAGEYVLSYDPATATKKPTPGKYRVTVTGTNASRMTDTASFLITVLNYTDEDIDVKDDYGILTPNVAILPISLSNAVDFARGDTMTVSGLPTGLKYNDKAAPYCISGIPTKPGEYTMTFTGKIVDDVTTNNKGRVTYAYHTAVATAFIKVKDFPTISAVLSEEATDAGNKVTGTGSFKAGTKVTLKATAAKDWVFAGWSGVEGLAALNPSLAYVMDTNDLTEVEAEFIHKREDCLEVRDPGIVPVVKGMAISTNLIETLIDTRSLPTVTVSGLPTGLKFDAKTFLLSGIVGTKAKSEYVYATVAAKNASGYTFTRIIKFVVLEAEGDDIPEEPVLANEADIDFSDLDVLVTGLFCPQVNDDVTSVGFVVYPSTNDAAVTAVSVSGLPTGLKSAVSIEDGIASVSLFGTPSKPGRYTLKVQVTYSDKKKATSQYAFIVEDGGSGWLDVESFDAASGTVSGSGVYASGATVKLSAKPANGKVFSGWHEDEGMPFYAMPEMDGVDYRTASATFVFRKEMFSSISFALYGDFIEKPYDDISIEGLDVVWNIDPEVDAEQDFEVNSASLPKLTVSGLPKGVTMNATVGKFVYSSASQAQIVPGYYTVTLKAVNQSNASTTEKFSVFVANKTTDEISGLKSEADAYPLYAGVTIDPTLIMPEVDVEDGWKLAVAGLPAGLKLVQDKTTGAYSVTGIPTKAVTNTVTFTATNGKEKEVATITVSVAALPAWANGTYDGAYYTYDGDETNAMGAVSLTVSAAGKVSGKILTGGKTYSFAAASIEAFDAEAGEFVVQVEVPWTKTYKETFLLSIGSDERGIGYVAMEPTEDGAKFVKAVQNVWLRKDLSAPDFATGEKQPVLNLPDGIICKFGAKGVVTLGGKIDTVTVSGKAQLLDVSAVEGANAQVVIYLANTRFDGGAICEIVDMVLSDEDDDGKLDSVKEL
jgi:hypothetical protein